MSRKGGIPARVIIPDPVYGSEMLQRLINRLMMDGKKGKSEYIVYRSLEIAAKRLEIEPLDVFEKALTNISPNLEVRPRRVGGQTYQVPMDVRAVRRRTLALRWLVTFSRRRSGKSMVEKLSGDDDEIDSGEYTATMRPIESRSNRVTQKCGVVVRGSPSAVTSASF